jgi:hypothetical protein
MDTLYYRKIAEIVMRDEPDMEMKAAAGRALDVGRDSKGQISKRDRRLLKEWMRRWCDDHEWPIVAKQRDGAADG